MHKKKQKITITPTPKEDIQLSVGKLGSILVVHFLQFT